MTINFRKFVETPSYCPWDVEYTFSVAGYSVFPSFITYNTSGTLNNTITVNTGDANLARNPYYNVTVIVTKDNTDGT